MADIAQLGIEVDSRKVRQAEKDLDNLDKQSVKNEKSAKKLEVSFNAAAAGIAAAGAAAVAAAVHTANQYKELESLAQVAGNSVDELVKLSYATDTVGVSTEKLADISKDTRERLGEFIATGGGGFADFFEQVAPKIGLTAEALQGLSGTDVLIAVKKAMEDANVPMEQQIFYLESIASNTTMLIPLLEENGAKMKELAGEAGGLGFALSELEQKNLKSMNKSVIDLNITLSSFIDKLGAQLAPAVQVGADLLKWLLDNAVKPLAFGVESLGTAAGVGIGTFAELFDFITSPSQWNSDGVDNLSKRINNLGDVAESEFERIALKWAGMNEKMQFDSPKTGSAYSLPTKTRSVKSGAKSSSQSSDDPSSIFWGQVDQAMFDKEMSAADDAFAASEAKHDEWLQSIYNKAIEAQAIVRAVHPDEAQREEWTNLVSLVEDGFLTMDDASTYFVERYGEKIEEAKSFNEELGESLQDVFADWLVDFDGGLNGLVDSFSNAVKKMAAEWAAAELFKMGGDFMNSSGGLDGLISAGMSMLPSFDGGGSTPNIPRSGGIDGNGGFLAVMHGNETVVDKTRGGSSGITVIQHFNFTGAQPDKRTMLQVGREAQAGLATAARRNG